MKIHEYQGKEILRKYGVPVPRGKVAISPDEAYAVAKELGSSVVVVKSQIHAGGRGKGKIYQDGSDNKKLVLDGGVKVVKSPEEAKEVASKILGNILVTHQTGPEGKKVQKLLIEEGLNIAKEYYLGLVLDRVTSRVTIMASTEGGMEIEEVAAKEPEKILKLAVDPAVGFMAYQGRELAFGLGLGNPPVAQDFSPAKSGRPEGLRYKPTAIVNKFVKFCAALYRCYTEADCSLMEINPLVLTKEGDLLAIDAKVNFEDNALYRHPDYEELRDLSEENKNEIEASKYDLSYISLNGNIGCMVNGAGLAMSTMDIIKLHGGEPANFLDVGGGADEEKVTAAFKIILSDPNVKAILVNIFGGIMKCDVIAMGVVAAAKEMGVKVPLVVRLQGTNVKLGKKILAESGLKIIPADTMADAAQKVVATLN